METRRSRSTLRAGCAAAIALVALLGDSGGVAHGDPIYRRLAAAWLTTAYERKASGDLGGAVEAFEAARRAGADAQRVSLELAYTHLALGETDAARDAFEAAAQGADADLSRRAGQELHALPSAPRPTTWWADLYAESYGWNRASGAAETTDLVPTLRLRGYRRLSSRIDLDAYVYAQATRDVASRGFDSGAPSIYADNRAMSGAGLMLRVWQRRVGLFAQAGPAVALIDDGRDRIALDARAGAFLGLETAPCSATGRGTSPRCEELYAEVTYLSRFDNDVFAFARARQSLRYLETRPLRWLVFWEVRGAADRNGDYYDNFVDVGAGPRWRLGGPVPIDLLAGAHLGRYLGRDNIDPAPDQLDYLDLRILATTYLEF